MISFAFLYMCLLGEGLRGGGEREGKGEGKEGVGGLIQ